MELDGIEVFATVVEARSFAKAAQRLRMPPATVSAKIARLEHRLGVTLIQRTTRSLHVTPAGEVYYRHCARAVADMREAQQQVTSAAAEPAGKLRITAPLNLAQTIVPPIVERYLSKYPKASIELIVSEKKLDLLVEGIDLAIRAGASGRLDADRPCFLPCPALLMGLGRLCRAPWSAQKARGFGPAFDCCFCQKAA